MSAAAKPLGGELIAREQVLDQLFARGEITPDRLAIETEAIGELNGRLRSVHLAAHLETALCCIPIRSLSMSPSEGMATRHQRLKISPVEACDASRNCASFDGSATQSRHSNRNT
jgi:hypothetical protein